VKHGYGLHSFAHALVDTFERLSVEPVTPELHAQIQSFAKIISDHPIEILPDVLNSAVSLRAHHLILMTKAQSWSRRERSSVQD